MHYIVDTHAFVWFLEDNNNLGINAKTVLSSPDSLLVFPTIVLAEISHLFHKNRFEVDLKKTLEHIDNSLNSVIYPLDNNVVANLPNNLNIHDAIIVSTALVYQNILKKESCVISKDNEIVKSNIVHTIW